jgi:hypothetical protein
MIIFWVYHYLCIKFTDGVFNLKRLTTHVCRCCDAVNPGYTIHSRHMSGAGVSNETDDRFLHSDGARFPEYVVGIVQSDIA